MTQPLPQGDCEVGQLPVDENRVIITLSNATESQGASVASSVDGRLANAEGTDVETSRLPRARSLRKVYCVAVYLRPQIKLVCFPYQRRQNLAQRREIGRLGSRIQEDPG